MNRPIAIRSTTLLLAVFLGSGFASAQTSASAQAGAAQQPQASASAESGPYGAQASGSGSAASNADGAAQISRSGVQASGAGNGSASSVANASAQAGRQSAVLADGTTMNAVLSGTLDAKKNKPGDRVIARTTRDVVQNGKTVVPKGTELIGHVTAAQARTANQAESTLSVAFDQAHLRNGRQIPLQAGIQALAMSQSAVQTEAAAGNGDLFAAGGGPVSTSGASHAAAGGVAGGNALVGKTVSTSTATAGDLTGTVSNSAGSATADLGATANGATHATGNIGGLNASGVLTSGSHGVFGLQGMSLASTASSATQGSMIVSATRNVHLDNGTQMLLQVQAQ